MDTVGKLEKALLCDNHEVMEKSNCGNAMAQNKLSLKSLARAISLSSERFSLVLVRCNSESLKQSALEFLEQWGIEAQTLNLPGTTRNLNYYIEQNYQNNYRAALIIFGLEAVGDLDEILVSMNQNRNEFRREFSFPLVLWVNDAVLHKMVRLAPDFYNWASVPINLK